MHSLEFVINITKRCAENNTLKSEVVLMLPVYVHSGVDRDNCTFTFHAVAYVQRHAGGQTKRFRQYFSSTKVYMIRLLTRYSLNKLIFYTELLESQ